MYAGEKKQHMLKRNYVCMSKKIAMREKKLRLENVEVQGSNPGPMHV
jgi:hypothetical protein